MNARNLKIEETGEIFMENNQVQTQQAENTMILTIKIKMDNAAFEAAHGEETTRRLRSLNEPARILKELIRDWPESNTELGEKWHLQDVNGNNVGLAKITR